MRLYPAVKLFLENNHADNCHARANNFRGSAATYNYIGQKSYLQDKD